MKKTYFGFQRGHAVKLTSRRFALRNFDAVAYKSDGKESKDDDEDDEDVKFAVKEIKKSIKDYKDEVIVKAFEEVEKLKGEGKTISDALKQELDALKVQVLDIDGKVINMDAKRARETKIITKQQYEVGISNSMVEELMKHKDELAEMSKQTSRDALKGKYPLEVKVPGVVTSGSLSGVAYNTILDWRPGMEPIGQLHVRDLVRTIQSEFDTVHYPRANTPIGAGSVGEQVNETDTKAQVDRGYTMIDLTLKPNAAYIIVSRPSLRNIPFLGTWLPTSMLEQLQDYEDASFSQTIVGAATGVVPAGDLTTGINADNLIKIIKNLKKAKYTPTAIAADPDVWANFLTYKASGSGEYTIPIGTVTISNTGVVFFLGIPLYPVNWLTGGRVVVADWNKIAIVESEGLTWRMSENVNDQFIKNEVTFLIERVEGIATFRPDAIATAVLNHS